MKIIILHGDDTQKSYERLTKFIDVAKERSWEVVYIESNQNIKEALSSTSLFGSERFFILKNVKLLSNKDITWINKNSPNISGNLIIYNEGVLSAATIKNFSGDTKVEEFKLPVLIWKFLDGIVPGSANREVTLLHKILEKEPAELVFSLIARHLRDLYWVKTDAASAGFPFWKLNKLKSQAANFKEEELASLIEKLSQIDIKVKSSKADIISELDLFLIKQLE